MTKEYDAIIIGTGQSGPPLAGSFHRAGKRTAIIERHKVGGSCVNFGCIPTKALVASAKVAHQARRADEYGIDCGQVKADMGRIKARMREISGDSNKSVTQWLEGMDNVTLFRGHARFESPHSIRVGPDVLTAPQIFINVGARARVPDLPGLREVDCLTSSGLLELEELPQHLVVVGGGYIGLEFAQMYRRFGSQVTVIEMEERLTRREDGDVAQAIEEILVKEGIALRTEAECISFHNADGQIGVGVECAKGGPGVTGSHVLLAVGRVPNTHDLGLDKAGITTNERGYIAVDDQCRSQVDGIWAIGDCNGKGGFTHTSYNDYEIVSANLLQDDPRRISDRIPCYGLYIDPPLGRIGMNEQQARQSGRPVLVGKRPMSKVGRAKEFGETEGFIKVLVDADSEEILGASILGLSGDEVVHGLLDVMYAKKPYTVISRAVHIHPTVSELIPTVLQSLKPLDEAE